VLRSAGRVVTFMRPFSASFIGSNEYTGVARFLRFVLWFALLVGVLVLIVLPLALGPLLAQQLRDRGLEADTLDVSVALFDPGLVLGHARSITVEATGVTAGPAHIGQARITLSNVGLFDRTFETVSGELSNISVSASGETLGVDEVQLSGPADAADATGRLSRSQAQDLVLSVARRQGLELDQVTFTDNGVSASAHGFVTAAQVAVHGGALVFDPGSSGAIVLVQPEPSDAWRLDEAWISADGLNVHGTVDMARLVSELGP
jgi:hypothetical protein